MRKEEGLTLIELLVVIVMIGVLTAIAIPVLGDAMRKAYRASALANARICVGSLHYASQNGDNYTPPAGCTLSSNPPSCTCTVSGLAGSVTCTLIEGGSVNCD